jgi:hypothetical protein
MLYQVSQFPTPGSIQYPGLHKGLVIDSGQYPVLLLWTVPYTGTNFVVTQYCAPELGCPSSQFPITGF